MKAYLNIILIFLMCMAGAGVCAEEFEYKATATEFSVSPVFDDGMVLQQNEPIKIWGTSPCEGESIMAVLADSMGVGTVKNGQWQITLAPRSYTSEPMVLEIFGAPGGGYYTYENITIGDVWWVMGQSNVEFSSSASRYWFDFAENISGDENIWIYDIPQNGFEQANRTRWRRFSRYSTYDASALGCFTAKMISDRCNNEIPLAIVTMGYAGHEITSFMPDELTDKLSYSNQKGDIYKSVVKNVINMPVKGLIWYQGEADAALYGDYGNKLIKYIEWMRNQKGQANRDFPVYCVELPPCFPDDSDPQRQYIDFGNVRAETGSLTSSINNFNICVTSDLWNEKKFSNNLHPDNKHSIASRLSVMILSREYGFGGEYAFFSPVLKSYDISADKKEAVITFEHAGDGISAEKFDGFQIIGENWDEIKDVEYEIILPDKLKVKADEEIAIVRYNSATDSVFGEDIFLKNSAGNPAAAFAVTFEMPGSTVAHDEIDTGGNINYGAVAALGAVFMLMVAGVLVLAVKRKKN